VLEEIHPPDLKASLISESTVGEAIRRRKPRRERHLRWVAGKSNLVQLVRNRRRVFGDMKVLYTYVLYIIRASRWQQGLSCKCKLVDDDAI